MLTREGVFIQKQILANKACELTGPAVYRDILPIDETIQVSRWKVDDLDAGGLPKFLSILWVLVRVAKRKEQTHVVGLIENGDHMRIAIVEPNQHFVGIPRVPYDGANGALRNVFCPHEHI